MKREVFGLIMYLGRFPDTFDSLLGFLPVPGGMVLAGLGILALLGQIILDIILARRCSLFPVY